MADIYMEVGTLAEILRGPDAMTTRVMDVRDEDFAGGHIRSCVNVTSDRFYQEEDIDTVISQYCTPPITKVVVHCMFSEQRGPRCAMRLVRRLNELQAAGSLPFMPSVFVLRGGWKGFYRSYQGTELIETD
eukprot:gene21449-28419_t